MKEFKTGKFKVRLRTAPVKLKAALVLLIVLSMGALLALRWVHNGIQAETRRKTEQAAAMGAAAREAAEPCRLDRVLPQVMELYLSAVKPCHS